MPEIPAIISIVSDITTFISSLWYEKLLWSIDFLRATMVCDFGLARTQNTDTEETANQN